MPTAGVQPTVVVRIVGVVAIVVVPLGAWAQSAPQAESAWRVSAGYETFGFRDVARSRPPVDGSPVRWEGSGPIVTVDYQLERPLRLHRFEVSASSHGDFSYETGAGAVPRPSDDGASFLEAQYDYLDISPANWVSAAFTPASACAAPANAAS